MTLTCPKCQGGMRSYERNGVTIDQCNECRGIFLDRGELEKLVDAETSWHGETSRDQQQSAQPSYGGGQHGGQQHYSGPKPKKKRSFMEDLFD